MERKNTRKSKLGSKLIDRGQNINIKVTLKEDQVDAPEVQEKLPIDKLVDIATNQKLLKEPTEAERWQKFIKGIKLHDIIYDCMQSSLNEYCKAYNKQNPNDNLRIKLLIRKRKAEKTGVVFAVSCILEVRRNGTFKEYFEKRIDFTHIKEIRDEDSWKYSLYGAVYNDLITHSLNYLILQDDVKSGRIKPNVPAGPTNAGGGTNTTTS